MMEFQEINFRQNLGIQGWVFFSVIPYIIKKELILILNL